MTTQPQLHCYIGQNLGKLKLTHHLRGDCYLESLNEHNTFMEREVFSLDNFHLSRGAGNLWYIVLPVGDVTVPVEINDMFEGIMVLRALGLKKISFGGLMESDELVTELFDEVRAVKEIRDERVAQEVRILNETKK